MYLQLIENLECLTNYLSSKNGEEVMHIAKLIPKFIDQNFEKFFEHKNFGIFLNKISYFLIISFDKYLNSDPNNLNNDLVPFLKSMLKFISLSESTEIYNIYETFTTISLKRILSFLTSSDADKFLQLFFIVLFSSSNCVILTEHSLKIFKIFKENRIWFHRLVNQDQCAYVRALTHLFTKTYKHDLIRHLHMHHFFLLNDFLSLLQMLFRHINETSKQEHSVKYLCRLLVYTTSFLKVFITRGTVGKISSNLMKSFAETFLEAANSINELIAWKRMRKMKVFIYDFFNNEDLPVNFWYEDAKLTMSHTLSLANSCLGFNFAVYIRKVRYRPILDILGEDDSLEHSRKRSVTS